MNKDGLIYVDLDLKDTPSTSTEAFVIHGADDRTQYVDIDFNRRADPPRDTDNEKSQNEKEKEKAWKPDFPNCYASSEHKKKIRKKLENINNKNGKEMYMYTS